jgi:hypothetical protein
MGPEAQLTVTLELLKTPCRPYFPLPSPLCSPLTTPSLSVLVHIPRPRISEFSHHVTKQFIETPARSFLSITTNAIEMTIIADEDSMQELAQAAQDDLARWQRSKHKHDPFTEPLEISDERWSVFIVETHEEQAQEQPAGAIHYFCPLISSGFHPDSYPSQLPAIGYESCQSHWQRPGYRFSIRSSHHWFSQDF